MMKAVLIVCGLLAIAAAQTRVKGLEQVARGYDVIFERIRAPLVTFTYDEFGQTWNNPYVNNQVEQIPDQLYITPSPGSYVDEEISLFNTWSSVVKSKTTTMGIDAGFNLGAFSFGGGFKRTKGETDKLFKNGTRNFASTNRILSLYQLDLMPGMGQSKQFQMMSAALPNDMNGSNANKYLNFIRAFGTHYVQSVQLGGKVNITTAFNEDLINQYGSSYVSNQVKVSIGYAKFTLGLEFGNNNTIEKNDHKFSQQSEGFSDHIGGDPVIFETQGYNPWVLTLANNPAAIPERMLLAPLHELMPDTTRTNVMLQALIQYCTKADGTL